MIHSNRSTVGPFLRITAMAAIALLAGPAQAAEASDTAAARGLALEGITRAESGNCKEAIDLFERAERLVHAPTHLHHLGACQIEVGRLVEGTEILQRLAREVLPKTAPAPFVRAQEQGAALLAATLPRLGKLDRKSTRLNSSHSTLSRMPSSA